MKKDTMPRYRQIFFSLKIKSISPISPNNRPKNIDKNLLGLANKTAKDKKNRQKGLTIFLILSFSIKPKTTSAIEETKNKIKNIIEATGRFVITSPIYYFSSNSDIISSKISSNSS